MITLCPFFSFKKISSLDSLVCMFLKLLLRTCDRNKKKPLQKQRLDLILVELRATTIELIANGLQQHLVNNNLISLYYS